MKKIQVTLDDETVELLGMLAASRAGTKSFVVREAVRRMSDQEGFEQYLDWLEQKPRVRASLERALTDEREGRVVSHEQALRRGGRPRAVERDPLDERSGRRFGRSDRRLGR